MSKGSTRRGFAWILFLASLFVLLGIPIWSLSVGLPEFIDGFKEVIFIIASFVALIAFAIKY